MKVSRLVLGVALMLLLVPAARSEEPGLRTRLYDVGPLLQADRPPDIQVLGLTPTGFEPMSFDDEDEEDEPFGFLDGDALVELVMTSVPGGWDEDESTRIELEGRRLLVRASAAAQGQVEQLLEALWAEATRRVRLEGHHLLFDDDGRARLAEQGLLERLATGRVDLRTRRALIATADLSSSAATLVRPGAQGTLGQVAATSYVRDYVVEIAQDSIVGDPVVDTVATGWFVDATPHLLQGGDLFLEARLQTARLDEPLRRQALEAAPFGSVDLPACRVLRLVSAARLKPGEGLVLASAPEGRLLELMILTPTVRGEAGLRKDLRRWDLSALTGLTPRWRQTTDAPNVRGVVDAGPLNPPRFVSREPMDPTLSMDDLVEAIGTGLGDEAWESESVWLAGWGRALVARNKVAVLSSIEDLLVDRERAFGHASAKLRVLEIEGDRAVPVATATVPLPFGRGVSWQAGTERAYVADWGVEVAQEARTGEPQIATVFGGLAFDARLDPAPTAGAFALTFDLHWADLDEMIETRRLGNECTGIVEVPRTDRLDLHADLVLRLGTPARIAVGTREDGRRLALEITLVP